MKFIRVNNEIVSLENVRKVYIGNGGMVFILYFGNEETYIKCDNKANAEKVLEQIYEFLSKNS